MFQLVSEYGFEAERHLYRTVRASLDVQAIDEHNQSLNPSNNIHLNYWLQEISSLISKPNFSTLICYAFDAAITQKVYFENYLINQINMTKIMFSFL